MYTLQSLKEQCPDCSEFTIHPETNKRTQETCWWLWGFGEYPEHSVNHGQFMRIRIECFDTLEQAKASAPEIEISDAPAPYVPLNLPKTPPDWFDPMAAGEHWSEDDY